MHILLIVIGLLLLTALIFGPQYWTSQVLKRYSTHNEEYPGTGSELARHLLDRLGLTGVKVEATDKGDHYDPSDRTVRLTPDKFDGKSLTAIVVAAHEVGHAIQHHDHYRPFKLRQHLAIVALFAQKMGALLMMALPVLSLISRSPTVGLIMLIAGFASFGLGTLVHFVTLPVEWDASFKRALPMLHAGEYIPVAEQKAANKILTAAALTYVSASLASLLNLGRWLAILRR
jgi:Zn-dependent membrane protease YugP